MDAHLFTDLVPQGTLSEDGPQNGRRVPAYALSLWFNENHHALPPCHFGDYLSLRGWDQELLRRGRWRAAHPDNARKSDGDIVFDAIAVIQAWMTLGFLEDLYQSRELLEPYLRPVKEDVLPSLRIHVGNTLGKDSLKRFLNSSTGTFNIFNTQHLVSHLVGVSYINDNGLHTAGLTPQHFARLPNLITHYVEAFNNFTDLNDDDHKGNRMIRWIDPDTEFGSYFPFTLLLPKLIYEAVAVVFLDFVPDIHLNDTAAVPLLKRMMQQQNGWCPQTIEKLFVTTRYTVIHWLWASSFNPLDRRNHSSCTTLKCHAVQVSSESEYPESHAKGCDGKCVRFYPDLQQVLEALSTDCVPVIVATPSSSDPSTYTFDISSLEPEHTGRIIPYVAFSHVWSDGLGSTTEKGIPSCQANHLAQTASHQLPVQRGSICFWIDSACIPSAPVARQKAIQLMSSTYKRAHTVVVLDATLAKVSLNDSAGNLTSPEYLLFRIYTSPWGQRVWTYQEGVLAERLVFLLAEDKPLLLNFSLAIDDDNRGPLFIRRGDSTHIVATFLRTQVQALNGQLRAISIATVVEELRWRDTLHRNPNGRNDEILATSVILNLDLAELLKAPEGPARMVRFYQLVGRWYRNIIFAEAPRLQIDGFRWAPSTLLSSDPRRPVLDLDKSGVDCVADGLIGEYVTFACADGQEVQYDDSKRFTLIDERRTFDIGTPSQKVFSFTHIMIYPEEVPESTRNIIFVAVAVREDPGYSKSHHPARQIDLVATFQTVLHLGLYRERDAPVPLSIFPNGAQLVIGKWQKINVLLR